MKIVIDRKARIMLLKWLQCGIIDTGEMGFLAPHMGIPLEVLPPLKGEDFCELCCMIKQRGYCGNTAKAQPLKG